MLFIVQSQMLFLELTNQMYCWTKLKIKIWLVIVKAMLNLAVVFLFNLLD